MKNKLAKRSRKLSCVCLNSARTCDEVAAWLSGDEGYQPQALAEALTQAAMELRDFDMAMSQLREEKAALLEAFKAAVERMEAVSEGIPVEKRSAGVSQATHVRHMAGHLAQHAKIARAAIARAENTNDDANARLIAAGPDLLEACKAVMAGDAFDERYRDLCAAAIRKAEGSAE